MIHVGSLVCPVKPYINNVEEFKRMLSIDRKRKRPPRTRSSTTLNSHA